MIFLARSAFLLLTLSAILLSQVASISLYLQNSIDEVDDHTKNQPHPLPCDRLHDNSRHVDDRTIDVTRRNCRFNKTGKTRLDKGVCGQAYQSNPNKKQFVEHGHNESVLSTEPSSASVESQPALLEDGVQDQDQDATRRTLKDTAKPNILTPKSTNDTNPPKSPDLPNPRISHHNSVTTATTALKGKTQLEPRQELNGPSNSTTYLTPLFIVVATLGAVIIIISSTFLVWLIIRHRRSRKHDNDNAINSGNTNQDPSTVFELDTNTNLATESAASTDGAVTRGGGDSTPMIPGSRIEYFASGALQTQDQTRSQNQIQRSSNANDNQAGPSRYLISSRIPLPQTPSQNYSQAQVQTQGYVEYYAPLSTERNTGLSTGNATPLASGSAGESSTRISTLPALDVGINTEMGNGKGKGKERESETKRVICA